MGMIIRLEGEQASLLLPRITRWSLNDTSGQSADRLTLRLGSDGLSFVPRSGTPYSFYVNGVYRGKFEVSALDEYLHPAELQISLTPAKFTVTDETAWREARQATYPAATIRDVVTKVMSRHGYGVRIDPSLADKATPHLNQSQETDKAFIARLAKKFDAIAKPVNGLYVVAMKGNIKTLSGGAKPLVMISPENLRPGTGRISFPSNNRFKGAKATFRDSETGDNGTVEIGESPFLTLKDSFKSKEEANERAAAKLLEKTREGQTFNGTVIAGGERFFAESTMQLTGFTSPRSKGDWSLDDVTLSGTRTDFSTQIVATRPR
ncbi:hypothetical protein [Photobacterium sp. WH24]|uniref:hypothetical protein n=1 Tax=Photobacterium sp. WH24 TaxID=2827237 RepID=UPI0021057716|nr:hypothetical protein [Photobacterium sp. WH24]